MNRPINAKPPRLAGDLLALRGARSNDLAGNQNISTNPPERQARNQRLEFVSGAMFLGGEVLDSSFDIDRAKDCGFDGITTSDLTNTGVHTSFGSCLYPIVERDKEVIGKQ